MHINEGISGVPNVPFNNDNSHSLDSAIKALLYLLNNVSITRKNELEFRLIELFNKFANNPVIKDIIENKLGYRYNN